LIYIIKKTLIIVEIFTTVISIFFGFLTFISLVIPPFGYDDDLAAAAAFTTQADKDARTCAVISLIFFSFSVISWIKLYQLSK